MGATVSDSILKAARRAKLIALASACGLSPSDDIEHASLPWGVAAAQERISTGWLLMEPAQPNQLGAALAWADRRGLEHLHVIVGEPADLLDTGISGREASIAIAQVLRRRASALTTDLKVWLASGRQVDPVEAMEPGVPFGDPGMPPPRSELERIREMFDRNGVETILEHGRLKGEILGLEIARLEERFEGWVLDVGVGRHDRQARQELPLSEEEAVAQVAALVRSKRVAGLVAHPANLLSRERWLRCAVIRQPGLIGARELCAEPPLVSQGDLRMSLPAVAKGFDTAGDPILAVFSVGVDLDLVPTAADHWLADGRDPNVLLVVPESDAYNVTGRLLRCMAASNKQIVTVPSDWASRGLSSC